MKTPASAESRQSFAGLHREKRDMKKGNRLQRGLSEVEHERARFHHLRAAMLIVTILFWLPVQGYAESFLLHEILARLGLRPAVLELDHVKKGGSLTAHIQDPSALAALGFVRLKKSNPIHLQNHGDRYWTLSNPITGQKAKIRIQRQNKPAKKPRIRIQVIHLTPDRPSKKK